MMLSLAHSSPFILGSIRSMLRESGYGMSRRATDEWEMRAMAKEQHIKNIRREKKQLQAIDESGARVRRQVRAVFFGFKRGAKIACDGTKKKLNTFLLFGSHLQ